MTKDYAKRFNSIFCTKEDPFFPMPETVKSKKNCICLIILAILPKVMSLRDGNKKMSKSDAIDDSRINLTDDAEQIYNKVIKAKTDSTL